MLCRQMSLAVVPLVVKMVVKIMGLWRLRPALRVVSDAIAIATAICRSAPLAL